MSSKYNSVINIPIYKSKCLTNIMKYYIKYNIWYSMSLTM